MTTPDKYIVVGPLRVDDMSGNHPDIIAGYPMPTAIAGLGYKAVLDLNRDLGKQAFKFMGAAAIVHNHSMQNGHPKNPVIGTDGTKGAPIIDEFKARASLSLVIALEDLADDPYIVPMDQEVSETVAKRMPGWFFGGGKVFMPEGRSPESLVSVVDSDHIEISLGRLPAGFVLLDRRDLLEAQLEGSEDPLDALLDLLELKPTTDGESTEKAGKSRFRRDHPGWLVPLLVGYQGIENPKLRVNARINDGTTPHLYAESLYSVGEYKSLRALLAMRGSEALDNSFWSHRSHKPSETYYVSAIQSVAV